MVNFQLSFNYPRENQHSDRWSYVTMHMLLTFSLLSNIVLSADK